MRQKDVLNSPRLAELKKKRRQEVFKKIAIYLSGAILIFAILVFISRIPRLNIEDVTISQNKVLEGDVLESRVKSHLLGKYLWFIPKSNFLIYPKNAIEKDLLDTWDRISAVEFGISNSGILDVSVTEREGKYTWCGEAPKEDAECFFLDNSGFVFDVAPYFSPDVYFRFYGKLDQENQDIVGNTFQKDSFQKLTTWRDLTEDINLKAVGMHIKEGGEIEMLLSSSKEIQNSPKILLRADFDGESAGENLQAAIKTDPLKESLQTKYQNLIYIDLRFGNKVYFKFE